MLEFSSIRLGVFFILDCLVKAVVFQSIFHSFFFVVPAGYECDFELSFGQTKEHGTIKNMNCKRE